MTKELLEILKKLRRYIEIQSDRIDILNHLATLKNKTQTREEKILARIKYDQAQAQK